MKIFRNKHEKLYDKALLTIRRLYRDESVSKTIRRNTLKFLQDYINYFVNSLEEKDKDKS